MRIQHVTPILVKRYMNENTRKRTVFLRGPSGIGKSEVVFQTSDLLAEHIPNWQGVVDLRLAQMDPTDLRGIPHVKEGRTHWARPDFFPADGAGISSRILGQADCSVHDPHAHHLAWHHRRHRSAHFFWISGYF
jgi:MoxR-like ATPase